jgi:hypothetical protein
MEAGDYAVVLKKPITASYVRKGELVKVVLVYLEGDFPILALGTDHNVCNSYNYDELALVNKEDNTEYFL